MNASEVGSHEAGWLNRALDNWSRPVRRQLNWLWSRGFRFLIVIDAAVLFGTLVAINFVRFGSNWPTYSKSHYAVGFLIATTLQLVINYFSGLYEREPRLGSRPWLSRVSWAMAIGVALDGLFAVLFDRYLMPRLNLGVLLFVGSIVLTGTRYLSRHLANQRRGPARVLLVGTDAERRLVNSALNNERSPVTVVGEISTVETLVDLAIETSATDVVFHSLSVFSDAFPYQVASLYETGIDMHQRVGAPETLMGLRDVSGIGGVPITRLRSHSIPPHHARLKRLLDLVLVALMSPLWIPSLLTIIAYLRITIGKPVFFRQTRVGMNGHLFQIYKFRTMVRDAELESGPTLATSTDARILRNAQWLRSSRLDELPQILNVLKNEMSLVGPRPERPEFVSQHAARIPGYRRRESVLPGLTGLAQVWGHYETDPTHKLGYDLQYLMTWSPVTDVHILLRTIRIVCTGP